MLLKDGELTIRNATEEDCSLLAKWWNDGKVMTHAGFPKGLGTTVEKIQEDLKKDSDIAGRRLIIENNNRPIGEMYYKNLGDYTADIGIKICEIDQQEKGYGKILLTMFIKELFAIGYEKIVLDTNFQNKRAQHVYEELGFEKVRINIDSWTDQLGNKQSSVDYRLNKGQLISFIK